MVITQAALSAARRVLPLIPVGQRPCSVPSGLSHCVVLRVLRAPHFSG